MKITASNSFSLLNEFNITFALGKEKKDLEQFELVLTLPG